MGRPALRITREHVVRAAVQLADEGGLSAVSMRAVAAKLSVTAMALYSRVPDKEALLDELVTYLLMEVPVPAEDLSWTEQLERLARELRRAGHRHPAIFPLLLQRPVISVKAHAPTEAIFRALQSAGLRDQDVLTAEQLFSTWILGFITSEISGRFGPGPVPLGDRISSLPAEEFAAHHALATSLEARDWNLEFDDGVRALLRLIAEVA